MMKTVQGSLSVCAFIFLAFFTVAAIAAEAPDFHGLILGMTQGQGDAEAKKQGLAVETGIAPGAMVYRGKVFGLDGQVLNAAYKDGKLTEVSVYLWGKAAGPKALSDRVLIAKGKELVGAFKKKYGSQPGVYASTVKNDDTIHIWKLIDNSSVQLEIGPEYLRGIQIFYSK